MKKLYYLFAATLVVLLANCGSSEKSDAQPGESVQPADPAITYGDDSSEDSYYKHVNVPLDGCFEIEKVALACDDEDDDEDKDDDDEGKTYYVTVNLKMVKAPSEGEKKIYYSGKIQFLDENGVVLEEEEYDVKGFSELTALKVGSVGFLSASKWLQRKKAAKMRFIRLANFRAHYTIDKLNASSSSSSDDYDYSGSVSDVADEMVKAQKQAADEIVKAQKEAAEEIAKAQKQAAEEMRRAMGM